MADYVGGFAVGTVAVPTTVITSPPVVVITAPLDVVTETNPTITWTYTSPIPRVQAWYRIAVEIVGGGIAYDSGRIEGTATTHLLGFGLTPFTTYRIHVGASDGITGGEDPIGTSGGWDSETVVGEFTAEAIADNLQVGSVYEIAINGVGYMLADDLENQVERSTAMLNPQAPGSDSPYSEQIDRYSFIGFGDFTAGEGQLYFDRPSSNPSRYWYSEWVNPFEPGQVSCNPTPSHPITSTFLAGVREHPRAVVASTILYVQTGDSELTSLTEPGASPTVFSTGLAGSIVGYTSDGAYWYVSDGASVRRNNVAVNPGADWSTVDVTEIAWCTDRLAGLDTAAVPPNFTTFSPVGAEENVGGWQSFTGATLRGLCGGDGYIWFGVNNVDTGHVRAWQVGSGAGTSTIALTLPDGESVDHLYFYLGNVFVATTVNQTPYNRKIYRCVPTEGRFTPQLLVTIDGNGTAAHHRTFFAGRDRFVACTWPSMMRDDSSGIGVVDLATSGYARWQSAGSADRVVTGVVTWAGDFGFTLLATTGSEGGFYGADPDADLHSGLLETSVADLGSNQAKVLDSVSLTTKPLVGTIDTSYSIDTNATFFFAGTMDGQGSTTIDHAVNALGTSFGIRVELEPNNDVGPVLKRIAAKTHPRSIADQVRVFPINCGDTISGLNDVTIEPDSHPGAGIERVQTLEALVGQSVTLQDVNWPQTRSTKTFQLVATEAKLTGAYDRNKNWRSDHAVCIVTLRRPLS